MDIAGKIIFALEAQSGTSSRTGNSWKSQDFVIETHEQYPKKCVFRVFGEDRLNQFKIQVGQDYTVSLDIDAHEYNGRWFNDIRAWRVQPGIVEAVPQPMQPVSAAAPAPMAAAPATDSLAAGDAQDDLPF